MLSTVPTQKQITLTSSTDWPEWFVAAKTYAQVIKIWHLVNPDVELPEGQDKPTLAAEGVYPTPSMVKVGATKLSDLNAEEKGDLSYMLEEYKYSETK